MADMQGKLTDFFELLDEYIDAKMITDRMHLPGCVCRRCLKTKEIKEKIIKLIDGEHTIRFDG